jgi:hypothetical protein
MSSSPKLPLFATDGGLTPPSTPRNHSFPFRRKRRFPVGLAFPLALLLIYLLLPTYLNDVEIVVAPDAPWFSHSGKAALETTIELPKIQFQFPRGEGANEERRDKVRAAIQRTWRLYGQEAWSWDEVRPVTGGGRDTRFVTLTRVLMEKWMGCNYCGWIEYVTYCGDGRRTC